MISKKMVKSITHQINREMFSSYLYLGMASYASFSGFKGIAGWFFVQVKEELEHAQKMYEYLESQGERVMLEAIEEPAQEYSSILDIFEKSLKHEKHVTALISNLMKQAVEEKDKATEIFLQWFVTEQIEEESNLAQIIQQLELIGEKNGAALFMLDSVLGKRGKE